MDTASIALLVSILSLLVSFIALFRDRHTLIVSSVPVGSDANSWKLHVTVANSGKRPITINHVMLQLPDSTQRLSVNFQPSGQGKLDVGESKTSVLSPNTLPAGFGWTSCEQLLRYKVFVVDALGKRHGAPFTRTKRWWQVWA